ncbi:hypothetical protein SAMN05428985_11556 [Nocardioides sp. YR527]|uniref:SCO6880 family protein n=1 Tax=Nocardioides sp. YR527 TaxID=1881028 RepID=UPI0008842DD5|nr:SCO6880 family protein [Nocardioides sp. YR527]SDL34569.1 hypothetical protein SAMN05428985_11556 [Nocardioides sp. YR527]
MSTTEATEIRYGNLRKPVLPGFFGLSAIPSGILLLGTLVMLMLIFTTNLWVGLIEMGIVLAAVLPEAIPTADGQGRYSRMIGRFRFNRATRTGENVLVQGLTGFVPDGQCRLPGVAAAVELSTARDVHGREFGLIHWTKPDLYSVVINCFPEGRSGMDKEVMDAQVAQWAAWLSQLASGEEIVGAQVVIDSAPDSGERLRRAVDRGRSASAPAYSQLMVEQVKESSRAGAPTVTVRITITFNAKLEGESKKDVQVRSREEMAAAIGDILPAMTGTLDGTGAGQGSYPATVQEITDMTRVAYDPAAGPAVEKAQQEGGTQIPWSQAGPITAVNHWDAYQHETALSRTWQMYGAPKGQFFAKVLDGLVAPHRDVAHKRVTLVYRPESAARSAQIAENDVTAARLVASQNQRTRAAHRLAVSAAEKTAEQESLGSPLTRVGLLVTVTVLDPADLGRASAVVRRTLAPPARLQLRLPHGAQDAAFVAGLPLGMVPYYHGSLASFADGM